MWSVGVILYFLVSAGLSPFWGGTEYRTQRNVLRASLANGGYDQEQFNEVSESAISCIQGLLVLDPVKRITAKQCLGHKWLTTTYLDKIKRLETTLIRRYLARRRWHRWFNAIKAMNRMKSFSGSVKHEPDENTNEPVEELHTQCELPPEHPEVGLAPLVHPVGFPVIPEYKSSPLSGRWV